MTVMTTVREYTGTSGWTTTDYPTAVMLAGVDASRDGKLFSEIYDSTNTVVGYGTYDGKEC